MATLLNAENLHHLHPTRSSRKLSERAESALRHGRSRSLTNLYIHDKFSPQYSQRSHSSDTISVASSPYSPYPESGTESATDIGLQEYPTLPYLPVSSVSDFSKEFHSSIKDKHDEYDNDIKVIARSSAPAEQKVDIIKFPEHVGKLGDGQHSAKLNGSSIYTSDSGNDAKAPSSLRPTASDEDDAELGGLRSGIVTPGDLPLPKRIPRPPHVRDNSSESGDEKGQDVSTAVAAGRPMSRYEQYTERISAYLNHHYHLTREPELVLPSAPSDEEKYGFIQTHRALFCTAGILAFLCSTVGLWLFTLSSPYFYWFGGIATILQIHVSIYHLMGIFSKNFDLVNHKAILERQPLTKETAPSVDIYLPCCKEPLEILENTYRYVQALQYPAGRLQVHVLDDGGMKSVEELAGRYGFNYICREDRPRLKKAGNLRWAYARTNGDFFVIYDADFCPRHDFLHELIPRMMDDPKIAIIQTPQFFQDRKEHTWVEKGASQVQEMFYRWCQVNRNKWGASICVGSNAVYRREALIETGGTAEVGASEDVYTGFFAVSRGWTLSYMPLCLAAGVSPDKPRAFFSQQIRWCQGSTSLFLSKTFWQAKMTFQQRLCYLSGMLYYWAAAIGIFTVPLPGILMIWIRPGLLKYYNLAFAIPSILYGLVVFRLWSRSTHSMAVQHIKIMQSYAYLSALTNLLFGKAMDWVPTGNDKAHGSNRFRDMRVLAICWTFVYQGGFISGCVYQLIHGVAWYQFLPLILLDAFNLYLTLPFLLAF